MIFRVRVGSVSRTGFAVPEASGGTGPSRSIAGSLSLSEAAPAIETSVHAWANALRLHTALASLCRLVESCWRSEFMQFVLKEVLQCFFLFFFAGHMDCWHQINEVMC